MKFQKILECGKHGKSRHDPVGDIYVCRACIIERPKVLISDSKNKIKNINKNDIKESDKSSDSEIKSYKFGQNYKMIDFLFWRELFRSKFQKKVTYHITMYLRNGLMTQFLVSVGKSNKPYFSYMGGKYHLNPDAGVYDIHSRFLSIVYHQDVSEPFKIGFSMEELRKFIDSNSNNTDKLEDIKKALNPFSLMEFIEAQVIEKVINGGILEKSLKMITLLVIINLIATGILIVLVAKISGLI